MIQSPTLTPSEQQQQQLQQRSGAQPKYVITEEDKKRVKQIADAWKAYYGKLDPPLEPMEGEPDDNVMTNRMAPVVNAGVDWLFGKEVEISVEDSAPKEAQPILDHIWGRKEARIPLLQKLAMNGAVAGTAFLRIVPGLDGSFRLVVVDPAIVYVQTLPQDVETVLLYCLEYCVNSQIVGQNNPAKVYYREEIARVDPSSHNQVEYEDLDPDGIDADVTWQIRHWTRIGDRGPWTPASSGEPGASSGPILWRYPFAPLFACQNLPCPNDFWGIPDVTPDGIGLNNSLNLTLSCTNRILKLYGSPIIYAVGTGESVIDIKPGKIIGLPLPESKIAAVAIASDVANAKQFADDLRSDIDELTSVPGMAMARVSAMPKGTISGIAMELCFLPMTKKTDKKRALYGALLIDVSQALLALHGMAEELDIALAWQDPLPNNGLEGAQTAVMLQQLNISNTTLQRNLGFDPDEEFELKQTEEEKKLDAFNKAQSVFPPEQLQVKVPDTRPIFPQQGGQA